MSNAPYRFESTTSGAPARFSLKNLFLAFNRVAMTSKGEYSTTVQRRGLNRETLAEKDFTRFSCIDNRNGETLASKGGYRTRLIWHARAAVRDIGVYQFRRLLPMNHGSRWRQPETRNRHTGRNRYLCEFTTAPSRAARN